MFATEAKCSTLEISENLEAIVFHQLLPHLFWGEKNCLQMLSKRRAMGRIPWVCENPLVVLRSALRGGCLGGRAQLALPSSHFNYCFLFGLDCVDTQYLKCCSELIISVKFYSAKNWVSFSIFSKSKALVLVVCQNMTE